jgi:arabinofuranan 3-O-arabinosyltransferase
MREPLTVGIVIPTYNAVGNIDRLLGSIAIQSEVSFTVVVVDQGSRDGTVEIALASGCQVVTLPEPDFYSPPARSRNVGAKSVHGEILLHLDSDMELPAPDFLQRLVGLVAEGNRAIVIHELDVAEGFWARCKSLERSCYRNTNMETARAVTRELFDLVGGYDSDVSSGEDFLITSLYRKQTRIASDEMLVLRHHIGRKSLRSLLHKKFTYGKTARTYLHKAAQVGASTAPSIVGTSIAAYLKNWRLIRNQPLEYVSIFPMRAMEFAALGFGMWLAPRRSRWIDPDRARMPESER